MAVEIKRECTPPPPPPPEQIKEMIVTSEGGSGQRLRFVAQKRGSSPGIEVGIKAGGLNVYGDFWLTYKSLPKMIEGLQELHDQLTHPC